MHTLISWHRRALAGLAAVAMAALVVPSVAAAPAHRPPEPPPARAAEPRWGDFVDATDPALVLTQPDGTELRARMTDAAIGGALELDGYSIVKGEDGWWRYASGRGAAGLVAGSQRAGVDKRAADLRPGIGRGAPMSDGEGGHARAQLLRQLQAASRQASLMAAGGDGPVIFRFPVLMLATWWDEPGGQTAPQFQPGSDSTDYFKAILDGFGGNPSGSLTEYYFENSYGQFLVQVDVFGPFTSNLSVVHGPCYYGGIDPPGGSVRRPRSDRHGPRRGRRPAPPA